MKHISKQKKIKSLKYLCAFATTISLFNPTQVKAISINFNYDYDDTNNFFTPERKTTLEEAGQYFTNYINDSLAAITSGSGIAEIGGNGGTNTWTAIFDDPETGNSTSINNLEIAQDTITVFVGSRSSFNPGVLAEGGYGGFTAGGSFDFLDLIEGRGQAGALSDPKTDIGIWGGHISFNNTLNWHNTTDSAGLDNTEYDFLSVAIHELGHVFGYSELNDSSWFTNINGTGFEGTNSLAVYNSEVDPVATSVPLKVGSLSHWDDGVNSLTLDGINQEAALSPTIGLGERKLLTNLDYAGLEDIGWEVDTTASVPFEFSPGVGLLLVGGSWGIYSLKKSKVQINK